MLFSELISKLKTIRQCGQWGKRQDLQSLISAFESEFQELKEAISRQDNLSIAEEIGDLAILLCLLIIVLGENNDKLDEERIFKIAIKKIINRYPFLFPQNQLILPGFFDLNFDQEEALWEEGKRKMRQIEEYCFCTNKKCKEYMKPFSTLQLIKDKYRSYLQCTVCKQVTSLKESCLFYRFRTPKRRIIETIAACISSGNMKNVCRYRNLSNFQVKKWLQEAAKNPEIITEIICLRYKIRSEDVLEYLKKYK